VTDPQIPKGAIKPRTEKMVWLLFVLLIGVATTAAIALINAGHANDTAHAAKQAGDANAQALATANSKLTRVGQAPVPTPSVPAPAATVTVTATPPPGVGPSDLQVSSAVAVYCAAHSGCANGPTTTQVAQAVATYCTRAGECNGPVGAAGVPGRSGVSGAPGASGAPGSAGRDGLNATPEQVAAAVSSYCSTRDNCQGATGTAGAAGFPPAGFTFTIGGLTGNTTYQCTPDTPPAAGSQPNYTCTKG
jgi:hypothetical protein